MENFLVSIIVPIYNVEKYLNRCLKSIQIQTYKNIEVLMIDDGSLDNSVVTAKNYEKEDPRFKLYRKTNGGLSDARNYGLKYATGTFIAFIDSDDFIAENFIESLLCEFDPDTDVVIADYVIYNQNSHKAYCHSIRNLKKVYYSNLQKRELLKDLLTFGSFVMPVWKNMYRANIIKDNNILFMSEREIYAEDKIFNMMVYWNARKVKIIDSKIYYHLIVDDSLSQGYRANYFDMCKEMNKRILSYLENIEDNHLKEEVRQHKSDLIASAIFTMSKCDKEQAKKNLKDIISDPYTATVFQDNTQTCSLGRHKVIYFVAKLKSVNILFVIIKLMFKLKPIYRKHQQKEEFSIGEKIQAILFI
ncbi:glycosyltransferase [[Clostridium] spiroforme]|nr:glycosyltransferase [Thomasclavelia spiroformis]